LRLAHTCTWCNYALGDCDLDDAVEHRLRRLGVSMTEAHDIGRRPLRRLPAARGET